MTRLMMIALLWAMSLSGMLFTTTASVAQTIPREPVKTVELKRYLGKWHEQGRYDQSFQRGCEAVTAEYALNTNGSLRVLNTCRQGSVNGAIRTAEGTARVVEGSGNAKLKVTFFWPFEGDYWILDRSPDYSWAIVGDGSGQYLWILTRARIVSSARYKELTLRAARFGYDLKQVRRTIQ